MNIKGWFPLGWTGWISLQSKGLSRVFSNTTVQKYQFFGTQLSFGEENGNPLQYSCLENPVDRGAWWPAVYGITQSRIRLKGLSMHALEKEMATRSSVLAWRIPGMEEPGGLLSLGSHRVEHDWSDLVAAAEAAVFFNKEFFNKELSSSNVKNAVVEKPQDRVKWGRLGVRIRPKEKHTELDDRGY